MLKKDLLILVDGKLATNQHHGTQVEIANSILGCISSSIVRRSRQVINHFLFGTLPSTHLG